MLFIDEEKRTTNRLLHCEIIAGQLLAIDKSLEQIFEQRILGVVVEANYQSIRKGKIKHIIITNSFCNPRRQSNYYLMALLTNHHHHL